MTLVNINILLRPSQSPLAMLIVKLSDVSTENRSLASRSFQVMCVFRHSDQNVLLNVIVIFFLCVFFVCVNVIHAGTFDSF